MRMEERETGEGIAAGGGKIKNKAVCRNNAFSCVLFFISAASKSPAINVAENVHAIGMMNSGKSVRRLANLVVGLCHPSNDAIHRHCCCCFPHSTKGIAHVVLPHSRFSILNINAPSFLVLFICCHSVAAWH